MVSTRGRLSSHRIAAALSHVVFFKGLVTDTTARPCWICGAPSNSREHKIKKSDLVRRYGSQAFKNVGGILLHSVEGEWRKVQGPRANILTYDPLICSECNNAKSQPWDSTYEQFERWLFENTETTLQRLRALPPKTEPLQS